MADTTTNIKIKADAREVRAAGKAARDAFSPLGPREFRKAVADSQRELKRLVDEQLKLVGAMKGVERGSQTFKQLTKDLKASREQATALKGTIDSLRGAYGEFDRAQRRRQGFVAGAAQGLGITQYVPTGPGMMPRVAGAMAGGAARRFGGAMAAPFLMPGMGGLSQMLGSIPILGGFASGALQAGAGMFQQAVGFDRAKLANLYWAGGPSPFERGERLQQFYRGGARVRTPESAAVKAAEAELAKAQQQQTEVSEDQRAFAKFASRGQIEDTEAGRRLRAQLVNPRTAADRRRRDQYNMARQIHTIQKLQPRGVGLASFGAGQGAGAPPSLPEQNKRDLQEKSARAEERLAAAQEQLEQAKDAQRAGAASARYRAFANAVGGLGEGRRMWSAGFGTQYGFAPEQVQQMLGQFMGARGGVSTANAQSQADVALASQLSFGVSMQTSGKFARLGGFGAGGGLAGVLKAAVEQGLKGSLVPEYLDQLVNMGEESLTQGMKVRDIGRMMNLATQSTAILGALGVEKLQRGALTQGLGRSAQQLAAKGVQTPSDLLMLRAAGFDPRQGAMSYIKAVKALEGGMTPEMMVNLFQAAAEGTTGLQVQGASSPQDILTARAMHMARLVQSRGVPMKIGVAEDILKNMEGKSPEEFRKFLLGFGERYGAGGGGEERKDLEAVLKTGSAGLARRGAGLAVTSAQLQVGQIGAGARLAGVFVGLEKVGIQSVGVLGQFNKQLETVVGWMSKWVGVLDQLASGKVSIKDVLLGNVKPTGGGKVKARGRR